MNHESKPERPDFSQPLAALKQCHDRIRKELAVLESLPAALAGTLDQRALQESAAALLRYFEQAAPIHHADEEQDLIPLLQTAARDADAALLKLMIPVLLDEHQEMARTWATLVPQLQAIADGQAGTIDLATVKHFSLLYATHMDTEETHVATMARRLFGPDQLHRLGNAMRQRRGLPTLDATAVPAPGA